MSRSYKKNYKQNILIVLALVVTVGIVWYYGSVSTSNNEKIVAEINGKPVYESEAKQQLFILTKGNKDAVFDDLDSQSKMVVLREIAAQRLILEEAKNKGLEKDATIKKQIENFQKNILKQALLNEIAQKASTDEKVQAYYEQLSKEIDGKTEIRVKHILVDTQEEAEEIKANLTSANFEKVASEKSKDKASAERGGDLGFLISGNMIKEFEDALMKLSPGQISQPVQTNLGWHLIMMVEKHIAEPAKFEQVKAKLAQDLAAKAIKEYVDTLLSTTEIQIVASDSANKKEGEVKNSEEEKPAPVEPEEENKETPENKG